MLAVAFGLLAGGPWPGVTLGAAFLVALLLPLAGAADLPAAVQRAGVWWFGVAYVGFLAPHVVLLRAASPEGWRWVLFVVFVAMGSDTGGYFGGRWLGRTKLFPAVSPAKTVEGVIAAAKQRLGSLAGRFQGKCRDAWKALRAGLLRLLAGCTHREIGLRTNRHTSTSCRDVQDHVRLLSTSPGYEKLAAKLAAQVLALGRAA